MELPEEIVYVTLFSLNVCLVSECASKYYPYCESRKCSSSYKNTNEMATKKKTITMTISSEGLTKQKHCLEKHIVFSSIFLNSVNNVVKAQT